MSRSLRLSLIAGAVIVVLFIAAASAALWRLNAGPINGDFLISMIKNGIDSYIPDTQSDIGHAEMTWDNGDRSVTLRIDSISVKDNSGTTIAEVPHVLVHLSAIGLMFGQFLPLDLDVEHPQIKLTRDPDGIWRFGGNAASGGGMKGQDAKKSLARAAHNMTHALLTHMLRVSTLVLDVDDAKTQSNWSISVPLVSLESANHELFGQGLVELTQKDRVSTLDVHYSYSRKEARHVLKTKLDDITPSFFAGGHPATVGLDIASVIDLPVTGSIMAEFDDALNLDELSYEVHGGEGKLNVPGFWDKPCDVKSIDMKADYDREGKKLNAMADIDFHGPTLNLKMVGSSTLKPKQDLDFVLTAQIDNWPMDRYPSLWPKPIITNAYEWIAANLSKGKFEHGEGSFKGTLAWDNLENIDLWEGSGKISARNARVRYLEGMPSVEGVNGDAVFDLDKMTVNVSGGGIGDLRLKPFTIEMTGFEDKIQYIRVPLKITGPLDEVMKLINQPRLGYAKAIGIEPAEISGRADGTVEFRLPLLKDIDIKDMDVNAQVALTDVASAKLVKGVNIEQGNLGLALDKDGFDIIGPMLANKVPVKVKWRENFEEKEDKPLRKASVTGIIGDQQWASLGIDALKGTRGPATVSFDMLQQTKQQMSFLGTADFTATEIHVDQLNWKKSAGSPTKMSVSAEMDEGKNIEIRSVTVSGDHLDVQGKGMLTPDGKRPLMIDLSPMRVGRTDVHFHFAQSEKTDGKLLFVADGSSLDVSGLKGGHEPAPTDPRPKEFRIKVGKLYTSDTGMIADAQGYAIRDKEGWNEISLRGFADGDHKMTMDLAAKNGRRFFNLTCDDFGKTLKGLGVTDTVNGGSVMINGESTEDNPRLIEGTAKIGSFTVHDLPVLVVLLNAASPLGLPNLISGKMDFSRLTGKFRWQGDKIELVGVHAVSTSVALNIDGKVDMNSGGADLNGTIVPFSVISSVLNSIPLIGDIITGGKNGGVIAVAYSIGGTLNKPDVSVNPASLLTPGFLRNIFFGGSEDSDDTSPAPAMDEPVDNQVYPKARTNFNR